jgi:hypothetical protein
MNRLHVPEILRGDGQGGTAPADIESHSDDEVDDVDEDIDEDYDDVDDGYVDKYTAEKKKKAEPLPCSHSQFVGLLQDLLVFHAWYKCGAPQKRMIFRRFSYVFES